tara:strand:+ start:249 stop:467 length:219 start_codon:yes stop_codon:yes gene_type:complete
MRIGVMVGKKHDGSFEYIGKPGDVAALIETQSKETLLGNYVKTWIGDISSGPLKAKKCVGASKVKPSKKAKA